MYEMLTRWLGLDRLNGRAETADNSECDDSIPFNDQYDEPDLSDVFYYMEKGLKVNAIKAYREATGVGLKEAKAYVDDLEKGYKEASCPVLEDAS